jgi:hypothetical protein
MEQLREDVRGGVPISEMRKKYSPQFIREHYVPEWIRSIIISVEYLTWLFGECQLVSDINSITFDSNSYDNKNGLWYSKKISLLDQVCMSFSFGQEKHYDVVNYLLSLGAKSILGLDELLNLESSKNHMSLTCLRLLDAGATPSRIPNPFLTDGGLTQAYYSRLATRAACIAVLSLHGKLPAGQVAQQCLSRDMLGAVARAMWARRIQVMEESVAVKGL